MTACRGCMLLARGLKLFWQRAQREPELACMVTLGHLSMLCELVTSARAAAVVHYMIHMLAPVVLETPAQAPRSMGGRRGLLVLMLVSVRYIDCGPTVSVGPAATASVARGRATFSHVSGPPCRLMMTCGEPSIVLALGCLYRPEGCLGRLCRFSTWGL